jgi:hypothetical protein
MNQRPTPALEGLLAALILIDCKVDALLSILEQKKVLLSREESENKTRSLWESEYAARRQKLIDGMTDPRIPPTLGF